MTNSASSILAILFGVGVFAVIVAVGWRSVQNRRILRLQGADGHETIIVAGEGDEISSIETTTAQATVPAAFDDDAEQVSGADERLDEEAQIAGEDRLARVVSTAK